MFRFLRRYRIAFVALAVSALVHAAVFVSIPNERADLLFGGDDEPAGGYSATLDTSPVPAAAPTPTAKPAARHVARAHPKFQPIAVPAEIAPMSADPFAELMEPPMIEPVIAPVQDEVRPLDKIALAQPATPAAALEPPKFPVDALPANVSIEYKLTSAFADGHARYSWSRKGDDYDIQGEAEAQGFFALFLEGRLRQESAGKVTPAGLRPDHFTEHKPGNPIAEGIQFDWAAGKAVLDKGDNKPKTVDITGNTVDWLSMIFQLAHTPPAGDAYDLRVFTQRRFYEFHLIVVGTEEIEIPLGKVRTLHMRHIDPQDASVIDVWLGIDQHYLPVKLRYPVARNRLMVEQLATSISP
ncbi:MAG TPA: DUF3108 domain-containing protein [Usitatibacter sp.]|nr:DUF3108 domain-containing protein [Usitatibacter sp.]